MQLMHFGHSCLLADFGNTTVLFDPGNFSHFHVLSEGTAVTP
jgi:L-ascorbate metabolism protein UlaG (beta-lactamase superfamily)